MSDVSPATAKALVPPKSYDRNAVTAGIVHLSVGNFHRAHQAVYVDQCLALPGQDGWGILGVGLMDVESERQKARALQSQEGLYSLTIYPPEGAPTTSVIGSIVGYLHAPDDPEAVLRHMADPAVKIVTLTVTEGGYNTDETGRFKLEEPNVAHDLTSGTPKTSFGFITEALRRRRDGGVGPFTVMSCDNLRHNGHVMKTALLAFARAKDAALADWIEAHVAFPSSMVDRITPATTPADAARLNRDNDLDDKAPVFAEDFIQWVIEDTFCAGRPAWEKVGAQFTGDVDPYEQVKLRMLNASHSMLAFPGIMMGHRIVHLAMGDPNVSALLDGFLQIDAGPLLDAPPGMSTDQYGAMLLKRYRNPAIGDQLLRIAGDGASKLPVFVQDTAKALVKAGKDHRRIAFLLAAFTEYLKGVDENGQSFPVVEPNVTDADFALVKDADPAKGIGLSAFKGWGVEASPRFVADYARYRSQIQAEGAKKTLADLLKAAG
ncbi:mannitol dehydrogenase family protein [Lichenihabitans sp. Uapishka_5]|uniref:mannitol dehydrogenase family protein n=1 Tax=Lichenihabitans sp. Uapishka_5 TaxID=3037302 RepID=UPI0029E81D6A|nr:mannitol dehydrogenase family protein [Lichenihabitans sp. Uapishka_5]MDX7953595.1 mannitol dehydrogenase family protein [Lichenihabitans sp. Uapishka_5]